MSALLALVAGTGLALLIGLTDLRWRAVLVFLILLPMMIPPCHGHRVDPDAGPLKRAAGRPGAGPAARHGQSALFARRGDCPSGGAGHPFGVSGDAGGLSRPAARRGRGGARLGGGAGAGAAPGGAADAGARDGGCGDAGLCLGTGEFRHSGAAGHSGALYHAAGADLPAPFGLWPGDAARCGCAVGADGGGGGAGAGGAEGAGAAGGGAADRGRRARCGCGWGPRARWSRPPCGCW